MSRNRQTGRRRKKTGNSQLRGVLVLCGVLGLVVALGVLVPKLLDGMKTEDVVSSLPHNDDDSVLQLAPGVPQEALPPVSFPEESVPVSEQPPEENTTPQLSFSEEEISQLNEALDEWAAEETFITITKDEEGEELEEPITKADGGHNVSVWFLDINSQTQYTYNPGVQYSYASLMKGPYAAWLYTLATQGQCDLNELVEVTEADIGKYAENTGVLKTMELPVEVPVETLISYMIRSSDTVALRKLLAKFPAADFKAWAAEKGVQNVEGINSVISGKLDVLDAGILTIATYEVLETNEYGPRLREHMEQAGNKMIRSDSPVAHKYGWDEKAYHDMAVVYAPHPYLMVVLTDKWGGSYAEMAMVGTVSRTLEGMMDAKWAAHEAENA